MPFGQPGSRDNALAFRAGRRPIGTYILSVKHSLILARNSYIPPAFSIRAVSISCCTSLVSLPPLKTFSISNLPLDIRGDIFLYQFALQWDDVVGGCPLRYGRVDIMFWPACNEEVDVPVSVWRLWTHSSSASRCRSLTGHSSSASSTIQTFPACCSISSRVLRSVSKARLSSCRCRAKRSTYPSISGRLAGCYDTAG